MESFSNLTQIRRDSGPLADFPKGFEGRQWGAAPFAMYVARKDKPGVALQLRWARGFAVRNMMKGDMLAFGLSLTFN